MRRNSRTKEPLWFACSVCVGVADSVCVEVADSE